MFHRLKQVFDRVRLEDVFGSMGEHICEKYRSIIAEMNKDNTMRVKVENILTETDANNHRYKIGRKLEPNSL